MTRSSSRGVLRELQRVLLVSYEYPPLGGGGGVMVRDLAEELARSLDVTVLTSRCPGLSERECQAGVEIVRTPVMGRNATAVASIASMLSFFPSSLWAGRDLLAHKSFDLVHGAFAIPTGPSSLLLARRARVPHVLSVLGGDIYDPSKRLSPHHTPLLKQTVRWVIHGSDRVVAESKDLALRTRRIYGERAIDRIPLAVNPLPFAPTSRAAFGLEEDDIVLVSVGRLVARKGLDQLIHVLASLDHPRLRLVLVGEGPLRASLEAQAQRAGIAHRVHFMGFVSDEEKWQILSIADVYTSTTLHEGFGIVFLEALESGLPVVCYDCGGQADFLGREFSRLIPLGDRRAFQAGIEEVCGNSELRSRMGEAARIAAKDFHVHRLAERYLDVYRECLSLPAP